MKCPKCGYLESKVIDSRPADENTSIKRRRECLNCKTRFNTFETIEKAPIIVIKKDGTRQLFDRNKIIGGILKSCEKRPVTMEQVEKATSNIERKIESTLEKEITSNEVGNFVMEELKELDEVAYVRFASVYRQFKDVESFFKELQTIMDRRK